MELKKNDNIKITVICIVILFILVCGAIGILMMFSEIKPSKKMLIEVPPECIPDHPAIEDFPSDIFTNKQRKNGYILIHIGVAIISFILLSVLCEFYFIPSLKFICAHFNIRPDVAGATLMAIGSSAPTLFISIISVFVADSAADIGLGTIVGSTIFNTLFIISASGLAIAKSIKIEWFPLMRDSTAYLLSTAFLIVAVADRSIHWYESVVFIVIYCFYVFAMYKNEAIKKFAYRIHDKLFSPSMADGLENIESYDNRSILSDDVGSNNISKQNDGDIPRIKGSNLDETDTKDEDKMKSDLDNSEIQNEIHDSNLEVGSDEQGVDNPNNDSESDGEEEENIDDGSEKRQGIIRKHLKKKGQDLKQNIRTRIEGRKNALVGRVKARLTGKIDSIDHEEVKINRIPRGIFRKLLFFNGFGIIAFMTIFLLFFPKGKYPVARNILIFVLSAILLGVVSYILVWMVCIIGYTYSIPDCVLGMTFLAAGSSIPDLMASIIVARENKVDMSIANAVGSNVFDMLCLGLPWFIKTTVINPGSKIEIQSQSNLVSGSLLIGTMLYTILAFYLNQWVLDKKIGVLFLLSYLSIIGLATVIELLACPCNLHL